MHIIKYSYAYVSYKNIVMNSLKPTT